MLTTITVFLAMLALALMMARQRRESRDRERWTYIRLTRALTAEAGPGTGLLFRRDLSR